MKKAKIFIFIGLGLILIKILGPSLFYVSLNELSTEIYGLVNLLITPASLIFILLGFILLFIQFKKQNNNKGVFILIIFLIIILSISLFIQFKINCTFDRSSPKELCSKTTVFKWLIEKQDTVGIDWSL